MEIIYKKRASGKTTELIDYCSKHDVYMVCKDVDEVNRVAGCAKKIGKKLMNFPLTFDELINKKYCGESIKGFVIDNADLFLQYVVGNVQINLISFTKVTSETAD